MVSEKVHEFDVTAVNSAENRELYTKREPIFPKRVKGKYRTAKWAVLILTLGIYYGLPWVRWSRGVNEPNQAVLVDFAGQRFYFFGLEIWPNELYFVTGLLVLSSLVLFLITSLFGRLWCGFSCPQTVWTDLFIYIERVIEGDRNKRLRLAKQPWNMDKIIKKAIKHSLWLLTAATTGGVWILYFHDAPSIAQDLFLGRAPITSYLFLGILTFTTYTLAGLMREQVCVYMCPWPRIQAAMTDADTFMVGYYQDRGEKRGKHKKAASWDGRGDCIDCKACVAVCPMGIDIRDGDQLECINCGLCVDACDEVMQKIDRPTGLIGYGVDYRVGTMLEKKPAFPKVLRSRSIFYGVAISIVSTLMLLGLNNRTTVEFNVERNRSPAYTVLSDGRVRNAVSVRVLNKKSDETLYNLRFDGDAGLEVSAVGHEVEEGQFNLTIPGDKLQQTRIFLTLPDKAKKGQAEEILITLTDTITSEAIVKKIGFIRGD